MINYTKRDFNSIKDELINNIPKYTQDWNDFSESDLGMIFIDFIAGVSSMLNYYIDKEVSELRIMESTEARNIYSNLELLGHKRPLKRCGVATAKVTANANKFFDSAYDFDITIPAFSSFTSSKNNSNNKYHFTNPTDIVIRQGVVDTEFTLVQGKYESKTYNSTSIQSYKLYLPSKDISDYFLRITVDGTEWDIVENAFLETQGGMACSIHRDAYDNVYLLFTYNYRNYLSVSSYVQIEYLTTEGDVKIAPNSVDKPMFTITNPDGKNITNELVFTNTTFFSGGYNDEDLNLAKAKAIARTRTPKFLCTLDDYQNAIFSFPGVLDAQCVDMSVKGMTNIMPYEVVAYILMEDNNNISTGFMEDLQLYLYNKKDVTRSVVLRDAIRKEISIDIEFTVQSENINLINLENDILRFLDPYYYGRCFERTISRDHILNSIINNFPEIKTINMVSPSENVIPGIGEVIDIVNISVRGNYYEHIK